MLAPKSNFLLIQYWILSFKYYNKHYEVHPQPKNKIYKDFEYPSMWISIKQKVI